MVSTTSSTAARLWHDAAAWRVTVIAAGVFTVLSIAHFINGSSSSPGPPGSASSVPPLPADPASDLRLADYEAAYNDSMKVTGAGERCEKLAAALGRLTDEDRARGRNVRIASKERIGAVAAGERCRSDLAASDKHFATFEATVAAAETTPTAATIKAAADADAVLDGFDRSRPRFAGEAGLLTKARAFAGQLTASDARITALVAGAEAIANDKSAGVYLRLGETMRQLTEFDRSRLTAGQRASLDIASQALATLNESRTRLARLPPLVAAAQGGTIEMMQRLATATAAITPFDEAVATPEQKDALAKARPAVKSFAWSLMQERVNSLAQGETPEAIEAVAAVYPLVKDTPSGELAAPQRALLAKGATATLTLAGSNERLANLVAAAETWRRRTGPVDRSVLANQRAITSFDQKRFQPAHKAAWDALAHADAIMRGPELGLNARTKSQMPIFVFSSRQSELDRAVADALRSNLRSAGFQIAASRNDAALLSDVFIEKIDEPTMDTSGVSLAWRVTAQVKVNAVWSADDSTLLSEAVQESVSTADRDEARRAALRGAVTMIAKMFESRTAR
jgi:hypothetical protein